MKKETYLSKIIIKTDRFAGGYFHEIIEKKENNKLKISETILKNIKKINEEYLEENKEKSIVLTTTNLESKVF
jgi:hypothetical protein